MNKINITEQQQHFLRELGLSGKSANTIKNYRTDLNIFTGFLASKGRTSVIDNIQLEELKEYQVYLEKKYNSPNSIRRRIQALRLFFDYLITKNLYDENPIKKILTSPKVVDKPRPTLFHQIRELNEYIQLQIESSWDHEKLIHQRNKLILNLIYEGGLKVSDLERLHQAHFTLKDDNYRVMLMPEKRDPITITLPKQCTTVINNYIQSLEAGKNRDQLDFSELLFNANPYKILSGGLSARGIEVIFKEFSKQLNTIYTAKNLRQACIMKWIIQEIPDSRIKEWMGVQPQYSLNPYKDLLAENPSKYCFLHLEAKGE